MRSGHVMRQTSTRRVGAPRRRGRIKVAANVAVALVVLLPVEAGAHPYHDEYVDKLDHGETERVSISSAGAEGNGDSGGCGFDHYSASDNGRFVAFASSAGNLHPSDVNGQAILDVFVYDRSKGNLALVSAMPNGLAPEVPASPDLGLSACTGSSAPAISGNGRYVAFTSRLPLTGGDDPEAATVSNVYVRDLKKRSTELVSRTWNGDPPVGSASGTYGAAISDNGRYVVFDSNVMNLTKDDPCTSSEIIPGLENPVPSLCGQIYVRDLKRNRTVIASRSSEGQPSSSLPQSAKISGNGRFVAFTSAATNLVPDNDTNLNNDVFVHDLRTAKTELVSVSRDGGAADDDSQLSDISDDGRFVLYSSYATDHVPANIFDGGTRSLGLRCPGTYLRDRQEGRTERISVTSTGTIAEGWGGSISDDGRQAAFHPYDLLKSGSVFCQPEDSDSGMGGKLLDRHTGQADWRTVASSSEATDEAPPGVGFGYAGHSTMMIGGNGRFIFGASEYTNVVKSDGNGAIDVFVRDLGNYPLGTGPYGGSKKNDEPPGEQEICVTPQTCVPPQTALTWLADGRAEVAQAGAKLYGASLAYRPALDDLYAAIELEHMGPSLSVGPTGLVTGGLPWLVYGLRFEVAERSYEVRATSLLGGTFGLFDCTGDCTEVATLKGGYGTTGERVVVSIPLDEIGLRSGGRLRKVEVFSALGTYGSGVQTIFDRLRLR